MVVLAIDPASAGTPKAKGLLQVGPGKERAKVDVGTQFWQLLSGDSQHKLDQVRPVRVFLEDYSPLAPGNPRPRPNVLRGLPA